MVDSNFIFYFIIILLFLITIYLLFDDNNKCTIPNNTHEYESMINVPKANNNDLTWKRVSKCDVSMDDSTNRVLKKLNINKTGETDESDIIFSCGYNYINAQINNLPINKSNKPKRIFIIDGADEITAKNHLWKNMVLYHGFNKASELAPRSYLLNCPNANEEIEKLLKNHNKGKLYIMKKNVQRQTGLKITDDIEYIKKNPDNYVIVQDLLEDSYLVNGRKINLRVYVAVICHKGSTDVYMFNNGFMYYTKQKFKKGDISSDNQITTGYVERDIYIKNPLTHDDFKIYLDMNENEKYHPDNENVRLLSYIEKEYKNNNIKISEIVFNRIQNLVKDVFISFKNQICQQKVIYDNYGFQIFGMDVAIDENFIPKVIEINKGPDLNSKDKRDGDVKEKLVNDLFEKLGIIDVSYNNGLIHVLEM